MRNNKSFTRIVVAFAICLGGMLMFLGCKKETPKDEPSGNESQISLECGIYKINEEEYIKMCAVPCIVSLDNIVFTLSLENHTKKGVGWGYPFRLEYFDGSIWKDVDLNLWFTLPYFTSESYPSLHIIVLYAEFEVIESY